jgi:hypothetical protein
MCNLNVTNPGHAPKGEHTTALYFKLQEYSQLITTNLNRGGLKRLATMTGDQEFCDLVEEIDLKEIVRSGNRITVHH